MAVALIQEFKAVGTDRTTTNYDHAVAQLDLEANPPPGLIVHTAGWDETAGVFRVHSVFRSADEAEAFVHDRLEPVLARGPVNLERTRARRPRVDVRAPSRGRSRAMRLESTRETELMSPAHLSSDRWGTRLLDHLTNYEKEESS